jgi:hypothetical protein
LFIADYEIEILALRAFILLFEFDFRQPVDSCFFDRDCIGDCVLSSDLRWAGTFGVNLDFVARSHCSVEFISTEDMQVLSKRLVLTKSCTILCTALLY